MGSILATQQLRANSHSTFPPPSLARQLLVNWGIVELTEMSKLRNGSKGDSNPGSLDCESDILPLIYRAPRLILPTFGMRH